MITTSEQAQERLDAITAEFENRFTLGPDGNSAFAATGEPFIVYSLGGIQLEGEIYPSAETAEAALAAYKNILDSFPSDGMTLYWRTRPEIKYRAENEYTPTGWYLYSRFLVSNKPRAGHA